MSGPVLQFALIQRQVGGLSLVKPSALVPHTIMRLALTP